MKFSHTRHIPSNSQIQPASLRKTITSDYKQIFFFCTVPILDCGNKNCADFKHFLIYKVIFATFYHKKADLASCKTAFKQTKKCKYNADPVFLQMQLKFADRIFRSNILKVHERGNSNFL